MSKNIWVAAGDGDLSRVQYLVETEALDPNLPDPFTYTPMHAAASYGHLDVLAYLISRGGNVNITDDDGDTPLYTVENIPTAQFLVDNGANIHHLNSEGISPIDHLSEDFPHVSVFLRSLHPAPVDPPSAPAPEQPSQHAQNAEAEHLTSALMASVADIMQRAEAEGRDPDPELRAAVSRTVAEGVVAGYQLTSPADHPTDSPAKRPRTDP